MLRAAGRKVGLAITAFLGGPQRRVSEPFERLSQRSQSVLIVLCERMRATEHAARGPCRLPERINGLIEIVERAVVIFVERQRVNPPCITLRRHIKLRAPFMRLGCSCPPARRSTNRLRQQRGRRSARSSTRSSVMQNIMIIARARARGRGSISAVKV